MIIHNIIYLSVVSDENINGIYLCGVFMQVQPYHSSVNLPPVNFTCELSHELYIL